MASTRPYWYLKPLVDVGICEDFLKLHALSLLRQRPMKATCGRIWVLI